MTNCKMKNDFKQTNQKTFKYSKLNVTTFLDSVKYHFLLRLMNLLTLLLLPNILILFLLLLSLLLFLNYFFTNVSFCPLTHIVKLDTDQFVNNQHSITILFLPFSLPFTFLFWSKSLSKNRNKKRGKRTINDRMPVKNLFA